MISNKKNDGTCFDNGGNDEFDCDCQFPFDGTRCEIDLCTQIDPCKNNGTCVADNTSGVRRAICNCPENTAGDSCQLLSCGNDIPCYNGGRCNGETCQCSEENGIAKYQGVSCDMPAVCNGNPCQNGGKCGRKDETDNTQVCFKMNFENFILRSSTSNHLKMDTETLKDIWMFMP